MTLSLPTTTCLVVHLSSEIRISCPFKPKDYFFWLGFIMRAFQQTVQKRRWPIFLFLYLMHCISISVPDHKHVFFCGDKKCINYFDASRDCNDNECIPCIRMLPADTKFTISKSRSRAEKRFFKFVKR